jgi:hypothetical protein
MTSQDGTQKLGVWNLINGMSPSTLRTRTCPRRDGKHRQGGDRTHAAYFLFNATQNLFHRPDDCRLPPCHRSSWTMSGGGRGTRMSTSGRPKSVSFWKGRMGPRGVRFCCFFRTVPRGSLQLLFALWRRSEDCDGGGAKSAAQGERDDSQPGVAPWQDAGTS